MDYSSWMDGSVWGSFSLKLPQLGRVESSPSIALEYSDPTVFPVLAPKQWKSQANHTFPRRLDYSPEPASNNVNGLLLFTLHLFFILQNTPFLYYSIHT